MKKILEKDFPKYRISSYTDLARFMQQKVFPYENQYILKRDIKNIVIKELTDIEVIFPRLSNKHQQEIPICNNLSRIISLVTVTNLRIMEGATIFRDYQ